MDDKKIDRSLLYLTLTLLIGNTLLWIDRSLVSMAIIPISAELNLSADSIGLILSVFFLGNALLMIPSGWLASKFGPKKVIVSSVLIMAIFSIVFGFTSSFLVFVLARFFVGVGNAGIPSSTSQIISNQVPTERKSIIQSVILASTGIGGVLAFIFGVAAINRNWRVAYIGLGLIISITAILLIKFIPKDIQGSGSDNQKISFKEVSEDKNVYYLMAAMFFLNILLSGMISWAPNFFVNRFNLSLQTVGRLLTGNALFQMVGTIGTGVFLGRLFLGKEKRLMIISTILSGLFIILLGSTGNIYVGGTVLGLLSVTSISAFTTLFTWPHKLYKKNEIGLVISLISTGGAVGALIAPYLFGKIITTMSSYYFVIFGIMFISVVLTCVSALLISKNTSVKL